MINLSGSARNVLIRWPLIFIGICLFFSSSGQAGTPTPPVKRKKATKTVHKATKTAPQATKAAHKVKRKTHETQIEAYFASKAFKKAIARLRSALKEKPNEHSLFLLSRALFLDKQYQQSAKVSLQFAKKYPRSKVATKARMLAAMAYKELRQYDKAQKIYAKQIRYLLSKKRRVMLANIYLSYAKKYTKKRPNTSFHKRKVITFSKLALGYKLPDLLRRNVILTLAKLYLKINSTWQARRLLTRTNKRYKTGKHADAYRFLLAKTYMKRREKRLARRTIKDLQKDFPKSKWLPRAYRLLAKSYGVPGYAKAQWRNRGIQVLQQFLKRYPKDPLVVQVTFDIAQTYYQNGRYDKAIESFRSFVNQFKKKASSKKRFVARASFRIALCYMSQKKYAKAIQAFQDFLKAHPTDRNWPQAQRKIVQAHYNTADLFAARKQWKKARIAFLQFLKRYPLNYRSAKIMWKLGLFYVGQKQYKKAIQSWQRLVSKYPRNSWGRKAKWQIGKLYETKLHDYAKALKTYRSVKYWRQKRYARKGIQRLTRKVLSVLTPRIYATNETANLYVTTRNLKSLNIRMYLIDAETYFRKMRCFSGMDKLDIQLIRPDKTWKVKVKKFQKYHLHKTKIAIPSNKPIVAVIHVSSGKLQATTITVISNLQMLSKINKSSIFVYALDKKKVMPAPNTRILVSDGKTIILEGKTNAKGVYQIYSKKIKNPRNIRIIALSKNSIAAGNMQLRSYTYQSSMHASGVVYTDRPVYQPGNTIRIRSIIREVSKGHFRIPTEIYSFQIRSPNGQTIFKQLIKPSSFGTFHTSFRTDPQAPLGRYQMIISRRGIRNFYGKFRLSQYTLPKYHISVKLKHRVVQRHQTIKGTITLKHGFGAPAINKSVVYRLGHLRKKGKTNKKGQLSFTFSTRELDTNRNYRLTASLLGTSTSTRQIIWLRATAFDLRLSTLRKVFAAGESFEVKLRAQDPLGTPHTAHVQLKWLKRQIVLGKWVETLVGKQMVELGKNGKGRASITLKKGGKYILRASTQDAFKQKITTSRNLFISGESDKKILRVLVDKNYLHVGETISVRLLSRHSGPALVTYESGGVLRYRLIRKLKKGETKFSLKIDAKLAPNFNLCIALLDRQKLHTATATFAVGQHLKIKVESIKKSWVPGSWGVLVIQTKDQSDKPVSAEVSVAVVDQALFAMFREQTPLLKKVFYIHRRGGTTITVASNTYQHRAGSLIQVAGNTSTIISRGPRTSYRQRRGNWNHQAKVRIQSSRTIRRTNRPPLPGRRKPSPDKTLGNFGSGTVNGLGGFGIQDQEMFHKLHPKDLRKRFATTAYWNPAILTDKHGKATIKFRLPENAATWKVWVRGVAKPTLVGEASHTFTTRKSFLVRLKFAKKINQGDSIQPIATIHNASTKSLTTILRLQTKKRVLWQKKFVLAAGKSRSFADAILTPSHTAGETGQLTLSAVGKSKSGKIYKDAVAQSYSVGVPGILIHSAAARTSNGTAKIKLKLPGKGPFRRTRLHINIGPVSAHWVANLAEEASLRGTSLPGYLVHRISFLETALTSLKRFGRANSPQAKRIKTRLEYLVRALWLQQTSSGGWGFVGRLSSRYYAYPSDPFFSAHVLSVLARTKQKHGIFAPQNALQKARRFVKKGYYKTFSKQQKAMYIAALTRVPGTDRSELFSYAHRLFRNRTQLSLEALAHLGFTMKSMNREHLAKQLVPYLEKKLLQEGLHIFKKHESPSFKLLPPTQIALALECLAILHPQSSVLVKGIRWLQNQRQGQFWASTTLTDRALRALVAYYNQKNISSVKLRIAIKHNGQTIKTIKITGKTPTWSWEEHNLRGARTHTLTFAAEGLGRYHITAFLTGYSKKPLPHIHNKHYRVKRTYQPAFRQVLGQLVKPGFSILQKKKTQPKRTVRRLPIGKYTRVGLLVERKFKQTDHDDIIVDEVIPHGAFVLPSSISVTHGSYILTPGHIRFFLQKQHKIWGIMYRMYGTLPGKYHIPGTRVWSFARPQNLTIGKPHTLSIILDKQKSHPKYPPTPNELYKLGQIYYRAKKWGLARHNLEQLVNQYKPKTYILKRVYKMLLQLAFKANTQQTIVHYFERLKELDPNAFLSFQQIIKIGNAYAKQKEYERAMMVYTATLQARFLNTLKIASQLEKEGEFFEAAKFTEALCLQYPGFKTVKEVMYALSQTAFQQANKHRAKPKKFKRWLNRADHLFRTFILMNPTHPSADTAAYTRANVLLEQKRQQTAIDYLKNAAKRYPNSTELDSMHYLRAYALYLKRKSLGALELLRYVSTAQYTGSDSQLHRSKHRYLARYLIAQIHHANNNLGKALHWYLKIRKRFPDADAQAKHFQRIQLHIPEVTTIGASGPATLKIKHQNIKPLTILAYRVDLMKLYILKKNLNAVTRINLAGIRPTYQKRIVLGKSPEFAIRQTTFNLPLEQRGAYLIVLKSKEREVSGILLRTRLKLEVQQEQSSGRVTAYLLNLKNRRPITNALTRVVATKSNGKIHTGKTDLRGVYSIENAKGYATIIAQSGDDFAFYRGKIDLQWASRKRKIRRPTRYRRRYRHRNRRRYRRLRKKYRGKRSAPKMLEHIWKGNMMNYSQGRKKMLDLYQQSQKGVQMKSLF